MGTALLADSAVTAPKIGTGVVVRSLNSQTDAVTLAGSNGLGVTQGSGTVTVSSNATATNTREHDRGPGRLGQLLGGDGRPRGQPDAPEHDLRLDGNDHGWEATRSCTTSEARTPSSERTPGTRARRGTATPPSATAALQGNASGYNTAMGVEALSVNATGWGNTATGYQALYSNDGGFYNTAMGMDALFNNTSGMNNTAVGRDALLFNTTGSRNIAIGYEAGTNATTGDDNIFIGYPGVAGDSHRIHIGTYNSHTSFFAEGIYQSSINDRQVFINSSGQLGTLVSSRAFKDEIRDMGDASDGLMRLRPVSFRYKQPEPSGERPLQYGLIAEEVAEVYPELVARSESGEPRSVRYHLLDSMLLNGLQKQHQRLQAQDEPLRAQDEEIRELRARQERMNELEARLVGLEAARGDQ